jgi:hypothetical protein
MDDILYGRDERDQAIKQAIEVAMKYGENPFTAK